MSEIDYAARVQRGAALLDEKWPTWAQDIDLDRLNIADGHYCVTAQYDRLMGGEGVWFDGMDRLNLDRMAYADHGFNSAPYGVDSNEVFATLNGLWNSLIAQRRAQAQPEASER